MAGDGVDLGMNVGTSVTGSSMGRARRASSRAEDRRAEFRRGESTPRSVDMGTALGEDAIAAFSTLVEIARISAQLGLVKSGEILTFRSFDDTDCRTLLSSFHPPQRSS